MAEDPDDADESPSETERDPFESLDGDAYRDRQGDPFESFENDSPESVDEDPFTYPEERTGTPGRDADDGPESDRDSQWHSDPPRTEGAHESVDDERRGEGVADVDRTDPVGGTEQRGDPFDDPDPRGDPFESGSSAFDRVSVGDVDPDDVWESLTDADSVESPTEADDETVEVSKHGYCETCEHFSGPPEVHCSHEGTRILEFTDMEHVTVVNCPVVAERRELGQEIGPDESV